MLYATRGVEAVVVPCLMLWALLYTLGLINEGRAYAWRFELVRLFLVVPLGVAATAPRPAALVAIAGVYIVASVTSIFFSFKTINKEY